MARKMKDSGIEWIGEIPTDFSLYKLKYLLSSPLCYGANESGTLYSDILPRYIRITDISPNGTLKNSGMLSLDESSAQNYMLHEGDILFARSGATVGKSFIYHNYYGRAAYAGYLIKASFNRLVLPEFVYYYTCSSAYEIWKNSIFIQSTIQNIGADRYSNLPISVPNSIDKQLKIVRYLNNFCSRFDAIIYNLQTSIEDYKKLKQAVITQAVTKGVRGEREMKDSGVKWIREIPTEWKIQRFAHVAEVKSNLVSPDNYLEYPQISPENIEKDSGKLLLPCRTVADVGVISGNHLFYKGQILYSKIRPKLNKVCIAPFDGLCSADMYPIETKNDTRYIMYCILSHGFLQQVSMITENRVKMPKINQVELSKILVAIPETIAEQKEIADYLDAKCAEIDGLIAKKEQLVKELESYKKSLIYEVVTGKREV